MPYISWHSKERASNNYENFLFQVADFDLSLVLFVKNKKAEAYNTNVLFLTKNNDQNCKWS